MFKQISNVILAPTVAFTAVKEKPTILFPLLIVITATLIQQVAVIHMADFDYLIGQMVQQAAETSGAPISEINQQFQNITPTILTIQVVVAIAVVMPIVFAIYGGYLNLVAKLSDDTLTFKHFYSLMCWSGIPVLISLLATLANLLISDGQFTSLEAANPLTLNNLLFGGQGTNQLLNRIGVSNIWGMVLMIIGFKVITDSGWAKAVIVPILPQALIYGLVFAFIA